MTVPEQGLTILLAGPHGAGKTTTALRWSLERTRPTFVIDWDVIANTLATADVIAGRAPMPISDRYALAAQVAATHAATITAAGVDCIVVAARAPQPPPEWPDPWTALDERDLAIVVLLPSLDACLARNAADQSRRGAFAVAAEQVAHSYQWGWDQWALDERATIIDTTRLTPTQVIAAAEAAIADRRQR